jgi:hypothetical protein
MSTATETVYRSMEGRARWAKALLLVNIALALALALASAASAGMQIELLDRAELGLATTVEAAADHSRQQLVAILRSGALLGSAVAFMAWFHGACRNLGPLGGNDLKYEPKWAVWGFLVPALNLARPHSVMTELWHGSDPATLASDLSEDGAAIRGKRTSPGLVDGWWILFIGSGILGQASSTMTRSAGSRLATWKAASRVTIADDLAAGIGCALAIRIVGRLTERQGLRARAIGESVAEPSAPS